MADKQVIVVPSRSNGDILRVVEENNWCTVERWVAGTGWVKDEHHTIRDVIVAPPASDDVLKQQGITD